MNDFPPTEALREIEKEGSLWASRCTKAVFSEKDFEFFATRYRPFFETLKKIEGRFQSTVAEFDPFEQHDHCRTLFAPAFGTHGAVMISPSMNPLGRVPDFRFAAFEHGCILYIRRRWKNMEQRDGHAKEFV